MSAGAFTGELARLDVLLHREILRLRAGYQLSLDELRGVYVSDEQVDHLVDASRADGAPPVAELTATAAAMRTDTSPLAAFAQRCGLTQVERDAILVALAPELDLKYEALYAYLNNAAARRCATVDLVLRLCGGDRAAIAASGRLVREGLLELVDPTSERRSELACALALGPALRAALLGMPAFDPRLAGWFEPAEQRRAAQVALPPETADAIARLDPAVVAVIVADPAQAPEAVALALARRWGRDLLRVTGAGWPAERWAAPSLALIASLRPAAIALDLDEWTADALRAVLAAVVAAGVPVIATAAPSLDWRTRIGVHTAAAVVLEDPGVAARRGLWRIALAAHGADLESAEAIAEVAEHFRLGPAQIDAAARGVVLARTDDPPRDALFRAARAASSSDLDALAQRVPPRHAWGDVVLPASVMRRLREVRGAVDARAKVFGDWGFGRRGGAGLMVLFAGTSGTGKTLSASVIAREIGLELYRIELASVVSKYIGETEKNLGKIFEAARRANVILFFDEADALLGRRSEVKDAHDRYANIEVAYLLQKMEEHDGVIILASNLAKNMDQAFARRMHYVVEFPRPDAPLRERLWRTILPPEVPLAGDVDFGFLARQFDLAGGDIKTVALDAAFVAAGERRALAMADLIAAIARQMIKQGRPPSASDFKQYQLQVAE